MERNRNSIGKIQNSLFKWIIGTVLLVGIFFLCIPCHVVMAAEEEKTVRVGQFDYPGFIENDGDDNYSGYAADYLDKMSGYAGWHIEYVYASWENLLQKLEDGDIDLLCSAQYTKERAEVFDYAKEPLGYEGSKLYVRSSDDRYYYNDYTAFDGMTVGIMDKSYQNGLMETYAKEHQFSYKLQSYGSDTELFEALSQNKVDAVLTGGLSAHSDYKMIAEFSSEPFYFVVTKGNQSLLKEVDDAMEQIRIHYPDFQMQLFDRYYGGNKSDTEPSFTREEVEYINNVGTIKVGNQVDRFPLCEVDKNGNVYGIQTDLLDKISKMSGLKFENEVVDNNIRAVDYMQGDGTRIFNGMPQSDFATFSPDIQVSDSLFSDSISFVTKKGGELQTGDAVTIAMPAGYINGEKVMGREYPNAEVVFFDTKADCLNALVKGETDFVLLDMYMSNALLQKPYYESLTTLDAYSVEQNMVIAALKTEDPRLLSIINKCIANIGSNSREALVTKYTVTSQYQLTFRDYLYKYRTWFMLSLILVTFVVLLLFVLLTVSARSRRKIGKSNQVLEETNERLRETVFLANQANQAKSDFLALMSHEIRTPMNAVIGETAIAQKHIDSKPKVEECLEKVMTSSKHLLNLINDILDMSAIESKKLKITKSEFDIKEIVSDITTLYYAQCKEQGIVFKTQMEHIAKEIIIGDQLRIKQIILNLLSNAVKFTKPGGQILFTLREDLLEEEHHYNLYIEVEDTGCGMSEEYMTRIFKPFEQEASLTSKEHGGSGLGLSITKSLVTLMDGTIDVESKVDQGTKFKISIPVVEAKSQAVMNNLQLSGLRTILIDDDEDTLEYVSGILDHIGVNYDAVSNSQEALHLITKARNDKQMYDMCLIDWKMEAIDGIALTKRIRKACGDHVMIVIASAYDINEIRPKAELAGVDQCISKPLFQSTVFNLLMKLSKGKLVWETAAPADYDFSGKRILLVDDTEINLEIAQDLLEMVNVTVETAMDGQEALEKFEASKKGYYDLILMDIQMPVLNGYDSAKAIRKCQHEDAQNICIVAMTANAFAEDIAKSLDAGMNDHISKPIDTELLYDVLARYLFN